MNSDLEDYSDDERPPEPEPFPIEGEVSVIRRSGEQWGSLREKDRNREKVSKESSRIGSRNGPIFSEDKGQRRQGTEPSMVRHPQPRKPKSYSDEESESASEYFGGQRFCHALDDSANLEVFAAKRTSFLNIMITGESKLCKKAFVKFALEQEFDTKMPPYNPEEKINEFAVSRTVRGQTRVTTFAHVLGFSQSFGVKDWYKLMKNYLRDKMEAYDSLGRLKTAESSPAIDPRIHLLFFFIKAPRLRLTELEIMKKLQKYAVVVPVIVDKSSVCHLSNTVRTIKLNMLNEMSGHGINQFLFDPDPTISSIRSTLIGAVAPFYFPAPNGLVNPKAKNSDLRQLFRLISAPHIITHFYQTEVLYIKCIEKIKAKRAEAKKQEKAKEAKEPGFSFGLALGIGLVGAIVALKNKII